MKVLHVILACLLITAASQAQAQSNYSKLIIPRGETLSVTSDSLYVDTLIMQDDSRLVFLASETKLVVQNAFIGKNCTWAVSGQTANKKKKSEPALMSSKRYSPMSFARFAGRGQEGSKGADGRKGFDGEPGRSVQATVLFRFLGELTIDTKGGYGSMGSSGFMGGRGPNGSTITPTGGNGGDGGPGGKGGDGGSISLSYACAGFTPKFNEGGFRSIYLDYRGGRGGTGGAPGRGGPGGMPTRKYDHSYAGNGVALAGPQGAGGTPGREPDIAPTQKYNNSYGSTVVVETEGVRGPDGRSGRMGVAGEDGKEGTFFLNQLN